MPQLTLVALLSLMPLANANAADLNTEQTRDLNAALNNLRQAKTNYELAEKSARGKSLSPAKIKLATIRVDSAQASLDKAAKLLASLPADQPNVKAAADAQSQIAAAVTALKKQLSDAAAGKPAPQPNPPTNPTTNPPTTTTPPKPAPPLPASQKKQLDQVDLILRGADVTLDSLGPMVDQLANDPASPGNAVQDAGARIMQTNAKLQQAKAVLQKLPLEHPKVAKVVTTWKQELARTQAMAKKLLPRWNAVQKVGGSSNYPTYAKDLEMLKGLQVVYRDHGTAVQYPETLAQTCKNDAAVLSELKRISTTYKPMIDSQTNEGNALAFQLNRVVSKRQAFIAAVKAGHPALVSRIKERLASVVSLRTQAVEEKKPLFLTSGIESEMERASNWIDVLNAYAPKEAAPFTKALAGEREAVAKARVTLKDTIIQANPLPSDNYVGEDRDELIKIAIASWKTEQPNAQVLAVRIPAQQWNRDTRWEGKTRGDAKIQGSKIKVDVELTNYDNSKIQVQLIVADENAKLAVIRPVNIWKNHTNNDKITAYNFRSLKDELQPNAFLLRQKVK